MNRNLSQSIPRQFTKSGNGDHLLRPGAGPTRFSYNNIGVLTMTEMFPYVVFRIGYLAGRRAREINQCVGLKIDVAENSGQMCGIKIIDWNGGLIKSTLEQVSIDLLNVDDASFPEVVKQLEEEVNSRSKEISRACVSGAVNTNDEHGVRLLEAARAGAALFNVDFESHGLLTTPQLHFMIKSRNEPNNENANEAGYFEKIHTSFNELFEIAQAINFCERTVKPMTAGWSDYKFIASCVAEPSVLFLDCGNGIGSLKMREQMTTISGRALKMIYRNENGSVSSQCGTDYIRNTKRLPDGMSYVSEKWKCASIDANAEKLIYFRPVGKNSRAVTVLDGSRIAALMTKFVKEQLYEAELVQDLSLGIILTEDTEQECIKFIEDTMDMNPVITESNVRSMHFEAKKFDIGIYFMPNGYGTVVFSEKFNRMVRKSRIINIGVKCLKLFSNIINEVSSDAIANLLAVELILRYVEWSIENWEKDLFEIDGRAQSRVVKCFSTEFLKTVEFKEEISELLRGFEHARVFFRYEKNNHSPTVYVEAATSKEAKQLGEAVGNVIRRYKRYY